MLNNLKITKPFVKFIISIVLVQFIGFFGALFNMGAIPNWYKYLNKPEFNPPNWIFAPVWTALYILIGIAFFLVWNSTADAKNKKIAYIVYFIQLALNVFWSAIFFGLKIPLLAFIEIVMLWWVIVINIKVFYRINKTAGLILLPYLFWVSFAAVLNYSIFILNR